MLVRSTFDFGGGEASKSLIVEITSFNFVKTPYVPYTKKP